MLNKITILQRVGIPVVADWLMVGSRTSAIREIPSVQGIKLNLRLHRIRPGQTSNFAIIPSTAAAGDIQADDTKARRSVTRQSSPDNFRDAIRRRPEFCRGMAKPRKQPFKKC
jgi:hypothetical protein